MMDRVTGGTTNTGGNGGGNGDGGSGGNTACDEYNTLIQNALDNIDEIQSYLDGTTT